MRLAVPLPVPADKPAAEHPRRLQDNPEEGKRVEGKLAAARIQQAEPARQAAALMLVAAQQAELPHKHK